MSKSVLNVKGSPPLYSQISENRPLRQIGRRAFGTDEMLLLILVLLTLGTRAYGITAPLVDYHSWRQTHTAMVAKNFATNGYNILNPQVDQFGPEPAFVESEFPFYQFAVAILYSLTGTQDWVARGVAVAFSCGAVVGLFFLVRGMAGRVPAFFACLFFAISPFGIFFGRAVMPESAMIFFSTLSLYLLSKWRREGKTSAFFWAVICSALAISIKLPAAHIILPALYLILARRGRAGVTDPRTCFFLMGALLPPVAWYLYAAGMARVSGASLGLISSMGGGRMGDLDMWLNPDFYRLVGRWLVNDVTTWAGIPFVALGMVHAADWSFRRSSTTASDSTTLETVSSGRFLLIWTVSVFLYFLGAANGLANQEYYILPAVPIASALAGVGLAWIFNAGAKHSLKESRSSHGTRLRMLRLHELTASLFTATCFVSVALLSFERISPLYAQVTPYVDTGKAVKMSTPENAVVVAVHHGEPEVLYYANRRGWHISPDEFSLARLEELRSKGATVAAVAEAVPLAGSQEMAEVLRRYPALATGPSLLVVDLTQHEGERKLAKDASYTFGQSMQLLGYDVTVRGGDKVRSVDALLRWKAIRQMPQDYRVSLRLYSFEGKFVTQVDGSPVNWFFPTTRWQVGDVVDDPYKLTLPPGVEPGQFRLELVVYDGSNLRPLSIDETGQPSLDVGLVRIGVQ